LSGRTQYEFLAPFLLLRSFAPFRFDWLICYFWHFIMISGWICEFRQVASSRMYGGVLVWKTKHVVFKWLIHRKTSYGYTTYFFKHTTERMDMWWDGIWLETNFLKFSTIFDLKNSCLSQAPYSLYLDLKLVPSIEQPTMPRMH
jgi:hypothetical protein